MIEKFPLEENYLRQLKRVLNMYKQSSTFKFLIIYPQSSTTNSA